MTPIKYIGHRKQYREGAYGSGLIFTQGETLNVEDDALAAKLLKHKDVYVRGDSDEATTVQKAKPVEQDDEEDKAQDARDAIARMNKGALETYAKTHFGVDLDKRKSVDALRQHVTQLFDQYGTGE